MKVLVDRDSCSGTGTCVRLVPGVFRLVKDGLDTYAEVISGGDATEEQLWDSGRRHAPGRP